MAYLVKNFGQVGGWGLRLGESHVIYHIGTP